MTLLTRPKFTVSLSNLAHNFLVLKRLTRGRAAAVVKTDAYGLGATAVVQRLVAEGCDAFLWHTQWRGLRFARMLLTPIFMCCKVSVKTVPICFGNIT